MDALLIWTRPATCFVSAVRLCLKQFHKDHYFVSQDVSQLNKIPLFFVSRFCGVYGADSYGPIENELETNDS